MSQVAGLSRFLGEGGSQERTQIRRAFSPDHYAKPSRIKYIDVFGLKTHISPHNKSFSSVLIESAICRAVVRTRKSCVCAQKLGDLEFGKRD